MAKVLLGADAATLGATPTVEPERILPPAEVPEDATRMARASGEAGFVGRTNMFSAELSARFESAQFCSRACFSICACFSFSAWRTDSCDSYAGGDCGSACGAAVVSQGGARLETNVSFFWRCLYCTTPMEAMAIIPAAATPHRRTGQANQRLRAGVVEAGVLEAATATSSIAGNASESTSRQSLQRDRCSITRARWDSASDGSANGGHSSAPGGDP